MSVGVVSVQAQACSKSKAAACAKKSATMADNGSADAAAKLASLDETIETRTCPHSGAVSYYKKETCKTTGNVSFAAVDYDQSLGKFVNVSPKDGKACCAKDAASGCCSKSAHGTATKTSDSGHGCHKPCSKGKATQADATPQSDNSKVRKS